MWLPDVTHFAIGEFFFGTSDLNTLDMPLSSPGKAILSPKGSVPEDDRYGGFVKAFETLQFVVPDRGPWGDLWPLREFFKDASADANRTIDKWLDPLICRALHEKEKRKNDGADLEKGGFLDHMVDSTNDIQLIRDEVFFLSLPETASIINTTCPSR